MGRLPMAVAEIRTKPHNVCMNEDRFTKFSFIQDLQPIGGETKEAVL